MKTYTMDQGDEKGQSSSKKKENKKVQHSPTFNKKIVSPVPPVVISDKMISKNISQNIKANLKPVKRRIKNELSPNKSHKYSKTFTHIDEIPGVFTFINNHVNLEFPNKERSLSPHSGIKNSVKSKNQFIIY
jgi:hypothetical protein